ncbi:MAG: anti-sigma factor [Chitinophagaceae bacterium]|nr:MAG: anti-sigma factor [Chitinophagaceae bacterium]
MNIQEYISSGIVESYVLGLASAEERAEFETNCIAYPEVRTAREAFELLLEKQAMESAVAPPAALKQKIFDNLSTVGEEKKVIAEQTPLRTMNWLKIAAAACFILLAGSLWWNMSLKNENRKLQALQEKIETLQAQLDSSSSHFAQMKADAEAIQKSSIKMAKMDGTANSPQSFATVYWDTTSHDVYLLVNNLPKPASEHQYQLWALLDGKPIDMGVLEISEKPLQLYRMKNAQAAQAFAITLEKKGGSPTPSMDKMYVIGKL